MGYIIPLIGRFMSEDRDAYRYPEVHRRDAPAEKMVEILKEAGFREAFYRSIFPGSCTIYIDNRRVGSTLTLQRRSRASEA